MKKHQTLLRRLTVSLLCAGLIAASVPVNVLATDIGPDTGVSEQEEAATSGTSGGVDWKFEGDSLIISASENPESGSVKGETILDYKANISSKWNPKPIQPWKDYYNIAENRAKITKVIVKEGVIRIGKHAFDGMDTITDYYLPSTLEDVKEWVFGVHSVENFHVADGNPILTVSDDGMLLEYNDTIPGTTLYNLIAYPCGKEVSEVTLPDGIVDVFGGAFEKSNSIKTLVLPDSVKIFGDYMFDQSVLESVTFGTGIRDIDEGAFFQLGTLTSITFPEKVDQSLAIGKWAFRETGLTDIVLPENTTTLGEQVFYLTKKLTYLKLPSTIASIGYDCINTSSNLDVLDCSEVPDTASFAADWLTVTPALAYYSSAAMLDKGAAGTVIAITNGGAIAADSSLTSASLASPTKEGYTFDGWYTDAGCTQPFTGSTPEAGTYYAGWKQNFTVTLKDGETTETKTVTDGESFSLPTPASRTGYTFDGWYNGDAKVENGFTVTGDLTLTARWTANTYTIAFDSNGGEGSMEPVTVDYDQSVPLPENTFTRTGYTFAGWALSSESEDVDYQGQAEISNLTAENGGTVTLYAMWIQRSAPKPPVDPVPKPEPDPVPVEPIPDPIPSINGWKEITGGTAYYKNGVKLKGWQEIDNQTYYFDQKGILQTGWLKLDENWYRLDETTGARQTGWVKVGKAWYFMEENGIMKFSSWLYDNGKWYYLGADGAMYTNQWRSAKGVWYYFLGSGEMVKNRWVEDKGDWYYLGSDGGMLTDTITPDGYRVDADGKWLR